MLQATINSKTKYNWKLRLKSIRKKLVADKYLYLLLLPAMTYYVLMHYIPMYGVTIAFKDYNIFDGIISSPWSGFDNFRMVFGTKDFFQIVWNTIRLSFLTLFFGFPGPIILALLLNEVRRHKFKKAIQTVVYLPHFLSWVVIATLLIPMLSPSTGVINEIIKVIGLEPIFFMGDKGWWIVVYVAIGIWKAIGWGSIIYLAALTGIDQQLYEAAVIDGANRWKQTIHVTLPGIAPTIVIMFILNIGKMMSIGFDQPFLLGNSTVLEVSDVISTYVYRLGLQSGDISRATAVGLFQSVINLTLLLSTNIVTKKMSGKGIF